MMRSRNRIWIAAAVLVVGLLPCRARADFSIVAGNVPQNDENVLLNNGTTGHTVMGHTQTTNTEVDFNSVAQTLTEPSNGQARIEATTGNLLGLDSISIPSGTFTSLIFN